MKFLEYDKTSGRIICELISPSKPEASGNCDFLEMPEDEEIDTSLYAVRGGVIVKLYESTEERIERERLRQEHREEVRNRLNAMSKEAIFALLDGNMTEFEKLQKEFRRIKVYI